MKGGDMHTSKTVANQLKVIFGKVKATAHQTITLWTLYLSYFKRIITNIQLCIA
jgi:hypothetical protein